MAFIEKKLTKDQLKAVKITDKPLIIVAGPGSGKTRVLTHKAVYLIKERKIKPSEIIMTTFTVKASEEMRTRISNMIKEDISNMFIGTIHSLCDNIIKQYGKERYVDYEVLDEFKRYIFVRKYKKDLKLNKDIIKHIKDFSDDEISFILKFYDILAENNIIGERLCKYREKISKKLKKRLTLRVVSKKRKKPDYDIGYGDEEIENILLDLIDSYEKYLDFLEKHKFMDFSRLETVAFEILQDEKVSKEIKKKIKYVMVDEFQDINPIQWQIIKKIMKKNNITIVGDKNQSIYAFRGANPNIFNIVEKELPNVKKIYLNDNFRSKKNIVDISNRFLYEIGRDEMNLIAKRKDTCKIWLLESDTEYEEARRILSLIEKLKNTGKIRNYGEVAIIGKSVKYHMKEILSLLDTEYDHIPYTVYAGSSTFLNPEIRSILFFISYVLGIEENDVIKYFPHRLNDSDEELNNMVKILGTYMFEEDREPNDVNWKVFYDPVRLSEKSGLSEKTSEIVVELNKLRDEMEEKSGNISILDLMYRIVGIIKLTKNDEKYVRWLKNIGKLSKLMIQYVDIYGKLTDQNYLNFLKLLRRLPESLNIDRDNEGIEILDNNSLVLSTVHQVKGLEFPIVIIPSLIKRRFSEKSEKEDYLIPKELYMYEPYPREKEIQNMFFVAITRAQDELILSTYNEGNNPSTFIEKLEDMLTDLDENRIDEMSIKDRKKESDENLILNYSAVSTFVDCPERFKYNYLYGMRAEQIFQQKIGTIYHNAIAKINQYIRDGDGISDGKIESILNESWIDLGDKSKIFRPKIKKSLKNYVKFAKKYIKKVIAIEYPVNIIIGNITIKGKADLIVENNKGEVVLIDFKSRKSSSIKETHVDIQLMMYARSLETDGMKVDKLLAFPLEDDEIDIKKITIPKKKKLVDEILQRFQKCVVDGNFPKTDKSSSFCNDCPYKFFCKYIISQR